MPAVSNCLDETCSESNINFEADQPNQEEEYAEKEEDTIRKELISEALNILNERELDIVQTRRLSEESTTLEELSEKYDISRERVRQIEVRALEKIKEEIQKLMQDNQTPSATNHAKCLKNKRHKPKSPS